MMFDEARRRYLTDPVFNRMVDTMVQAIDALQMSPGEMREAAVFAELLHHERRPPFIAAKEPR
jgi:hypothetical protein